ncbi:hypothetical protein FY528_07315 [Hymenobacter lutimineralis]|uniref:Uncharacterized protein n=1 Tax=Hymenobacter lutimineralis TaxID=2606448 RepID=A0A5D6V9Z1_9BACT|nr:MULTISPECIES: hypothetical protein [Hymenobacter]QIX61497.1 hypothetical protein HER32_10050 [Hymenobacter sp. BT18]TYZ11494.1 hypothetical protein FY528_07315 [Hymenobacter lutimineralis]
MADLHNPLFEDEKEFLERQKLEYERALLGDVENIKEQSQRVGKYALIGAGLAGSIWLIAKALRSKPKYSDEDDEEAEYAKHLHQNSRPHRPAPVPRSAVDEAVADDLGFGVGHHQYDRGTQAGTHAAHHDRADLAPDVYHTDADPFQPTTSYAPAKAPARRRVAAEAPTTDASSIVADAFHVFLQSDTGKMLIAQISAVLMAYVAKKIGEYLPSDKNPDLATSPAHEAATQDIDFTYHHDDANAPQQPV